MNEFTFIESFCGAGGLSAGLIEAGFKPLLAFDHDGPSVRTYARNFGEHVHQLDASQVTGKQLRKLAGVTSREEIFLFSGGPPCQGFSKQKKGAHLGDDRNNLVLEYLRCVDELQPKFFIFENVAIFGQKRGSRFFEAMKEELSGYEMKGSFLNAANYGLPQTRERFVIVGVRKDVDVEFEFPPPTVSQWMNIKQAIGDLPSPPANYSEHPKFPNHQNARVTDLNVERFRHVPQGGGWQDIPYELRLPCHQRIDTSSGGWPDVYGRLSWTGQCPTITGGFDSFTRGRYGHPKEHRPLTPREAARIQGFPDSFVFEGNRGDMRKQIGNAVPPPLAKAIGKKILSLYKKKLKTSGLSGVKREK